MNIIDLIVIIVLAFAIFRGWKQGLIVQVCSILGILCGIWLASRCGASVGTMLGMGDRCAPTGGFLVVLVVVIIVVALLSRIVKKLFKFVGLGVIDVTLGIALSLCKFILILSLLFSAFNGLNNEVKFVSGKSLTSSRLYEPIISISNKIFPALDWTKKQINSGLEKL